MSLRGVASAMIDLSDGLAADLGHILESSGAGASVDLAALPLSREVRGEIEQTGDWALAVSSGDDYELCFTLPPERRDRLADIVRGSGCAVSVIGCIDGGDGLRCRLPDGSPWCTPRPGYDHFPGAREAG
jgi:thiamine-monophosphate kinase